jgi:biotin transport system substrate-specific component
LAADTASMPTIADAIWPARQNEFVRNATLMVFGFCLLTLSAKIQVPLWPVPISMQTFAVLVIGMAYGWRLGAATVLSYLIAGASGLPVFAGTPERGIGLLYMMGPTGGFLVGFLIAAAVVGYLAERGWDRSFLGTGAAMIVGHAIISLLGVVWLAKAFGVPKAIEVGFTPFLWAGLLKTILGVACMPLIWKLIGRRSVARRV